jgi:hypothetical protein
MRTCTMCNTPHNRSALLCQRCYLYLKKHPEGYYPIPPKGTLSFALNGDPICHICGGAYSKLGTHITQVHNMTPLEYKDKFNLLHSTQLTSERYKTKMRQYNKKHYRKVVKKNLLKKGVFTRFRIGQLVPGRGKHIKNDN